MIKIKAVLPQTFIGRVANLSAETREPFAPLRLRFADIAPACERLYLELDECIAARAG